MDTRSRIYQLSEGARFGGIFTPEQCQALARKVLNIYDGNGDNIIENMEICNLMSDAYRAINKDFKPSPTDTVKYSRVITRSSERANVTLDDLEKTCLRLFGTDMNQFQSQNQTSMLYTTQSQPPVQQQPQLSQYYSAQTVSIEQVKRAQRPMWLQERLELAKKIFYTIDKDHSGYITQEEVFALLKNTCKALGLNYVPTNEDVQKWIEMVDINKDGKVSQEEFEIFVIKCMEKTGYKVDY